MAPDSFHNVLYLISSSLIIGDYIFLIQNRVQKLGQTDKALSSTFMSALKTYQVKRAERVAQAITETFFDQLPGSEDQSQQLEAKLEELVRAHRLALQDVI